MMHALRQHVRRFAFVAAGLTLFGAALLCAQLFTAHAQERPQRREKIVRPGETPPDAPAPASQTAAQSATEADCTIRRERRNYCARLVIADTSAPVVSNVTSTVVEVRNVSNDVTITGSNNYVETDNVSGYTTQNSNNSIQKASNSADVEQRGNGTISTVKDSFSANQSADNSYVIADNNVFARQSGFRSHQVARGEDQITEQTGAYSTNIAYASNAIQGGHNTANYFFGTANEDILTLQSNPIGNSYTGNRFFARMGGGDDYVRVEGTRITADIDGGNVVQLQPGLEQDWVVTTNADGSRTYTHEGSGNVVTVRSAGTTVIFGDNFPGDPIVVPPAASEASPLEKMQRLAERLGRPLKLSPRVLQADRLMRQRQAETEAEMKERLRRTEAAEQSGSIEQ